MGSGGNRYTEFYCNCVESEAESFGGAITPV